MLFWNVSAVCATMGVLSYSKKCFVATQSGGAKNRLGLQGGPGVSKRMDLAMWNV